MLLAWFQASCQIGILPTWDSVCGPNLLSKLFNTHVTSAACLESSLICGIDVVVMLTCCLLRTVNFWFAGVEAEATLGLAEGVW